MTEYITKKAAQPSVSKTEIVGDVIGRQAAIEIVRKAKDKSEAHRMLVQLSSAQSQPQWIPCSERLPEVREWVLCQCRARVVDVLRLTTDGYWDRGFPDMTYMFSFVVAWMPLPAPYRPEGDEKDEG